MLREYYPKKKHILLDSNLLVVLVIGKADSRLFGSNPVKHYSIDDYNLLVDEVISFQTIITTPYILSEVNGLLTNTGYNRVKAREAFRELVPQFSIQYTQPQILFDDEYYSEFGLTDVSVIKATDEEILALSDDGNLIGILTNTGKTALKFQDVKGW
jgi:hypothetical protein